MNLLVKETFDINSGERIKLIDLLANLFIEANNHDSVNILLLDYIDKDIKSIIQHHKSLIIKWSEIIAHLKWSM